jgi:hypothetical protein
MLRRTAIGSRTRINHAQQVDPHRPFQRQSNDVELCPQLSRSNALGATTVYFYDAETG